MKFTLKKISTYILAIAACVLLVCSCEDDYLTDGGVCKAETESTVYEYLSGNNLFDSLIIVIDSLGLKDSINNCGTFFAPTDYSLEKYMVSVRKDAGEDAVYKIKDLIADLETSDIMKYAFNERIRKDSTSTDGDEYTSIGGSTVTIMRIMTTESQYYVWSDYPVYFLYYCIDGKEKEVCQTSGILTENGEGPVLHVMNNNHTFKLFDDDEEE